MLFWLWFRRVFGLLWQISVVMRWGTPPLIPTSGRVFSPSLPVVPLTEHLVPVQVSPSLVAHSQEPKRDLKSRAFFLLVFFGQR